MRHASSVVAGLLALAAAAAVFELKGTVREVEREIARVERRAAEAAWRLRTLRADLAYLTRPERLAPQAAQLGLVPGTSSEVVALEAIAFDRHLALADKVVPVPLPTGQQLQLRLKPMRAAAARKLAAAGLAPAAVPVAAPAAVTAAVPTAPGGAAR